MKSDTPETDEKFNPEKGWTGVCDIDHARDLERRLAAMTITAKHEEESKEYNAGLCHDLERRLTVAREALDKIAAPAAAGKFQQAIARKALSIIGQKP